MVTKALDIIQHVMSVGVINAGIIRCGSVLQLTISKHVTMVMDRMAKVCAHRREQILQVGLTTRFPCDPSWVEYTTNVKSSRVSSSHKDTTHRVIYLLDIRLDDAIQK